MTTKENSLLENAYAALTFNLLAIEQLCESQEIDLSSTVTLQFGEEKLSISFSDLIAKSQGVIVGLLKEIHKD
jgi:hypothetical protein